jgi:hypothetical protein
MSHLRGAAVKIPFEQTITGAYRFGFANILSIIGIGWLPFVLFAAVAAAVVVNLVPLFSGLIVEGTKDQIDTARLGAVIGSAAGGVLLIVVTGFVAQAMVYVGLMRKALGQHPGPVFVFFSLGAQVWQLIGSYLLLLLLAWGIIAAAGGGIAIVSVLLGQYAPAARDAVTVVLVIAAYLAGIYAIIRASFFIPAVVVAENHIGLRRAWHLGKGNFWRIIGITIAMTLPLGIVVSTVVQVLTVALGGPPMMFDGSKATPAELHAFGVKMMTVFMKVGPYLAGVEVLYMILLSGLLAGATASAYTLVTGGGGAAPTKATV